MPDPKPKAEHKKVPLPIEVEVREDNPLFFKQAIGHAEADDGTTYALSTSFGGDQIILEVSRKDSEEGRMAYVISPMAIIDAVIIYEKENGIGQTQLPNPQQT